MADEPKMSFPIEVSRSRFRIGELLRKRPGSDQI
jgi:hypothetical protein